MRVGDEVRYKARATEPSISNDLGEDFASKAVLSARRSALVDEAVRRVSAQYHFLIRAIAFESNMGRTAINTSDAYHIVIAAIRAEFAKLLEERA